MHRSSLLLPVVVITLLLAPPAAESAQPSRASVESALQRLIAEHQVAARTGPRSGLVRFLSTPPGRPVPVRSAGSAEQRARAFLAEHGALFGLGGAAGLVTTRAGAPDPAGMEHVRFQQTFGGIPVTGGEITVHLAAGGVVAVHARTMAGLESVELVPTVQAGIARKLAAGAIARSRSPATAELREPRLELLDRGHLGGPDFPVRLAWFVEARRMDLREYVWIDARSGVVLLRFSQLTDALGRAIHDADDPDDGVFDELPGDLVRSEGEPVLPGTFDYAGDANAAYDFSGDTYDYFFTEHGRDSYDNAGTTLLSTVHFCPSGEPGDCPFLNAFWNGQQMVYGETFSLADDVDAHELTHAVTEHTANLFYYMQPGALNESFSDIFGETVDLLNGAGPDEPADRWLLAEDLPVFGPIRDMLDPTNANDPGKTSDPQYVCQDPGQDAGGVHSNSGVPNHAFALMVDGGTYNGVTVNGIGIDKAGRIQYRALSQYLVSSSNFMDACDALAQSCQDLVGMDGITPSDCDEVDYALAAVEMCVAPPACPTVEPALTCDDPEHAVQDLFVDDFEELPGAGPPGSMAPGELSNWTQNVIVQPTDFSATNAHFGNICCLGPFATSGAGNVWGYDVPAAGDAALEMASDVVLPAGAFVHFRHSFGFENDDSFCGSPPCLWDGGVIEYSTDGGASWLDAGSLVEAGQAYTGPIIGSGGNPLAGRQAFVADSFGFTATRLDLSGIGGEDFRFRFRIGTDSVVDDYGWFIDDFRIYTCEAPCPALVNLANHTVTGVESQVACTRITLGDDGSGEYVIGPTGSLTLTAPLVEMTGGFRVQLGGTLSVSGPT